jgi:ABC-type antimicrobial peptide transport system permease subunit
MLTADAHPRAVETKIRTFIANYDKEYRESDRLELGLQPYAQKYLHSNFKNGKISGGRIKYVRLFSLVALFVLLIACINFTNLSTARSIKRAREIGVRKVLGAFRTAVIKQFLIEALLYSMLALTISILLVSLLLPSFNELSGKTIVLPWNSPLFWAGILLLTLVTGLCAGSYPAFLLSSLKSLTALKGSFSGSTGSRWLGKGLVVFQFVLSIVFIVGMMVISKQVTYTQTKNLGYNKNNLLYLPITGTMADHFAVFKNNALELPGIKEISRISQPPVKIDNSTVGVEWAGKDPDTKINFTQVAVGYDFIKTMGSGIVLGRDFSSDFTDRENYLINETALKKIGYSDPIGKPLTFWEVPGTIIGVVRDFHFNSLHVPIAPLVIRMTGEPSWGTALIRAEPGKTKLALEGLKRLHQELNPDFPFAYQFADEEYAFLYNSELVAEKISRVFAFLAIFISCLGLLGLVLFASELRAREIGIRKVLGATVPALLKLLSKDYLVLIGLAFTIATPLAWMLMQNWLDNFEYKVSINWLLLFAVTGIVVVLVAIATVGYQTLKVALANPVKSLRTE